MRVSRGRRISQGARIGLQAVAISAACAVIAGCASDPAPNFFNGNYYMAGDSSCVRITALSPSRIMCHDSNGVAKGYRDAMTSQQIQMYQYQQYNNQLQMQQMNQSMQQTNQAIQQQNMQMYQQYQPYTPPAVTPIAPPGGNQVRCISTDIYTNCRY